MEKQRKFAANFVNNTAAVILGGAALAILI